jgi:hypothetical protein
MNKKLYNIISNEPTKVHVIRKLDEHFNEITDRVFQEALDEFPDTYELWDEIDSSNPEWEA